MKTGAGGNAQTAQAPATLTIPATITVRELADKLGVSPVEVIKELMKSGVMAAINQPVGYEAAAAVARAFGFQTGPAEEAEAAVARPAVDEEDVGQLQPRPPVVTVMGHVDHGKTTLLDVARRTNVAAREVGGITQHIGAYQVEVHGQRVTFIDTPGHEAFTAMRARGARVTDVAIIVVAADDGIMPQTVEAIDHAKAAQVPIVVAINKIDLPTANPERVKQQLTEHGLVVEEWGGETIAVPVSAKTGQGIDDLLENIILVAEIAELKANPNRPAEGTIIEAEMDASRGPMAAVIVQRGTLRVGDMVVAGGTWGRVKALFNERGQRMKEAAPSVPARIMGLAAVPRAGDTLKVVADEKTARALVEERERQPALAHGVPRAATLEAIAGEVAAGKVRDLNVVLKADVQGSLEAVRSSLERLSSGEVRLNIIHSAPGNVNESDVMLALASEGIVIGFTVRSEPGARRLAEVEGVEIRHYAIIYQLIEEMEKALKGMLEPVMVEVAIGHAEVRAIFRTRSGRVGGCYVRDGVIGRGARCRVLRGDQVLHTSRIGSLRRFQEDVREVQAGYECGIGVEGFGDLQEGDIIETIQRQAKS